jgi:phosphoribosyl-AMP cyclohydrolase
LELAFRKLAGLIPAVIQDHETHEVLMLGFVNAESLARTQSTGEVHFFSRSRNKLWKKGETSGHVLKVKEIRVDCDADSLLIRVEAIGPGVCHEGYRSCFFRELRPNGEARVAEERTFDAADIYGKKGTE